MIAYIVRRLFSTIVVMAVVAFVVFSLLYLTPGDPAALIAGDIATDEDIRRIHARLGLDDPFLVQFGRWLWSLAHGDLGTSIFTNLPVTQLIGQRIEPTVSLTLCTLVVAILVAVPLGVLAAAKAGPWLDRAVMSFSVFGLSVAVFVFAYIASPPFPAHRRRAAHRRRDPASRLSHHPGRDPDLFRRVRAGESGGRSVVRILRSADTVLI